MPTIAPEHVETEDAARSEAAAHMAVGPVLRKPVVSLPRHEAEKLIRQSKIMIVDDELFTVMVVRKHLENAGYSNFITTPHAKEVLDLVDNECPDIILLDLMMPEISGLEILEALNELPGHQHTPVLILTAAPDAETKQHALELGATDFLAKPVDTNDLIPRVHNSLLTKAYHDRLLQHANQLEQQVEKRTRELAASRKEILHCLARAAEYRDDDTGNHVIRVGRYAGIIARALGFSESRAEALEFAAQLHDVGKIGIPDSVLRKPGKLDPDEFAYIQRHCAMGKKIIHPMPEQEWKELQTHTKIGSNLISVRSSPLLMMAARVAQTHHERWDGMGYPLGLAGEDIPIEGRITSVADVFDALSSPRPYKPPFPRERCFAILREDRGTRFDPRVLDAFFQSRDEIVSVQLEYMDDP